MSAYTFFAELFVIEKFIGHTEIAGKAAKLIRCFFPE